MRKLAAMFRSNAPTGGGSAPEDLPRYHSDLPTPQAPRTLGVLADYLNGSGSSYQGQLQDAIEARCRSLGYNLLIILGRSLEEPNSLSAAHNAIFETISHDVVDGLIIISTCLAGHTGVAGIRRLAEGYGSLPLCSIGLALPGVASVISNNCTGMESVIEHVIVQHGCKRVAFIAGRPGNPEAQARFDVYRSVLARHELAFDPDLVVCGDFWTDPARAAVEALLERGVEFDGIVAANDAMAAGAIEALRKHGRRVPREIPVTGYDDLQFARLGNPPLTTVRQPLQAMANRAVDIVLDQIEGRSVQLISELPTELVVRHSCGCASRPRRPATLSKAPYYGVGSYVREHQQHLREVLVACLSVGARSGEQDTERLLAGLIRELDGQAEAFLAVVEDLSEEAAQDDERGRALQLALIALRHALSEVATLELEAIWNDAATVVALANTTGQALYRLSRDDSYFKLMQGSERTSMALDVGSLEGVLLENLPAFGIETAFLSRYVSDTKEELELFVSLLDGERTEPAQKRFPARRLLPEQAFPADRRHTALVYPLVFERQSLGIAVFGYSKAATAATYKIVRDQTSAALRNIALHQETMQRTMLHDRIAQERTATAQRMQSLMLLAGGVAHDLNNALGPLVALPDIILAGMSELCGSPTALQELRADVESIKAASVRAAQTIKDLLTLGRQGNVAREPLDLNHVIRSTLGTAESRFLNNERSELKLLIELAPEPLMIRGSEAHLARAITNLVRNAVEAMADQGQLAVSCYHQQLQERVSGYEEIEPGEYICVRVADSGSGIPADELTRVFEPFFTKKRAGERSGTGLGLAIVLGVIKEHDGFVDVRSTVGVGTTFTLYFPPAQSVAQRDPSVAPTAQQSARILIIDDEPTQLRTGRRVLRHFGYQVDTLESGRKACAVFEKAAAAASPSPYDLVIVDMLLNEDADGLQVFERIHQCFPRQKGIIASGNMPSDRLEQVTRTGLGWLSKPYTTAALARAVRAALDAP